MAWLVGSYDVQRITNEPSDVTEKFYHNIVGRGTSCWEMRKITLCDFSHCLENLKSNDYSMRTVFNWRSKQPVFAATFSFDEYLRRQ